jgi:hypothetical protein
LDALALLRLALGNGESSATKTNWLKFESRRRQTAFQPQKDFRVKTWTTRKQLDHEALVLHDMAMPGIGDSSLYTFQADPDCFQTLCGVLVALTLVHGGGYGKTSGRL